MNNFIKYKIREGKGIVLFTILLFLHLLPLFSVDILLTLDGPSHLYNAKLFNELLVGNETISQLYKINSELVPNYSGHLLLSFFLWVTTPILALKILHISYVIGIAFSFRRLVMTLNPNSGLISIIIFPFIYSTMFFYGFYNFSIAIIFLFITIRYWIISYKKKDVRFYSSLTFLFFCTYISHSFTFFILCLAIGSYILVEAFNKKDYRSILVLGIKAFLSALPSILLSLLFIIKREPSEYDFRTSSELWERAFDMSFLNKFEEGETFIFIWIIILYLTINTFTRNEDTNNKNYVFLFLSVISSMFYFFMPDGIGYACFISVRFLYIAILFLLIWLSQQEYSKVSIWIVVASVYIFQIQRLELMKTWAIDKNNKAKELIMVGNLIPENSIIKPIKYVNSWNYLHLPSFLGVNKPQVILSNYEANYDYFPIEWKNNIEKKNKNQSKDFFRTISNKKEYLIDYLIVIGEGKITKDKDIKQVEFAEKNFPKIYQSYFITLYKVKEINLKNFIENEI